MVYALCHQEGGLRLWISPETLHSNWNDTRNGVRRSGYQHVMLLSTVMSNMAHGPYRSGQNFRTIQEAVQDYIANIGSDSWDDLCDAIAQDKHTTADDETIPQEPADLANMECFQTLPIFDP